MERVIGTIKTRLIRALAVQNQIPGMRRNNWPRVMNQVIESYNNSYNRSVRMTPIQAHDPRRNAEVIANRNKYWSTFKHYKKNCENHFRFRFSLGDRVRIRLFHFPSFGRGRTLEQKWTNEIFKICARHSGAPPMYSVCSDEGSVIAGRYYFDQIQLYSKVATAIEEE